MEGEWSGMVGGVTHLQQQADKALPALPVVEKVGGLRREVAGWEVVG